MLKLCKNIFLLLFVLVVADRLIGNVLEYFFYKQLHGDDYITTQLLDSTNADMLVLGSSRASHHYIPDTIQQQSGLSCFNGGRDNMGIHYTEACINELLTRYKPKYIVLDIIPYNFILDHQYNHNYFEIQSSVLLPFANKHKSIYDDVGMFDQMSVWKSKAIKMYAYNSLIGSIFQNAFTHIGHSQVKGYEALHGKIDSSNYGKQVFEFSSIDKGIDTAAFAILERCLSACKQHQVQAIICFSPFYFSYQHEPALLEKFQSVCAKHHARIIDFSSDKNFTMHPSLFYDELHLNDEGAKLFSNLLAAELKSE